MEQKIESCKYCGGIAKMKGRKMRYVACMKCFAQGPKRALIKDAIEEWNVINKSTTESENK